MNAQIRFAMIAAMLLGAVGTGWVIAGLFGGKDAPPVVVEANNEAYKEKPEEAGGMDIPHQDKMVFNSSADGKTGQVERIMPPPEQPNSDVTASADAMAQPAMPTETPVAEQQPVVTETPAASAPTEAAMAPAPASPTAEATAAAQAEAVAAMGRIVQPTPSAKASEGIAAAAFDMNRTDQTAKTPIREMPASAAGTINKPVAKVEMPKAEPVVKTEPTVKTEPVKTQVKTEPAPKVVEKIVAPQPAPKAEPVKTVEKLIEKTVEKPVAKVETPKVVETTKSNVESPTNLVSAFTTSMAMEPIASEAAKQSSSAISGNGQRFQLASFTDRPAAERAVDQLEKKYGTALKGSDLGIVEASIKGKGRVYRIQGESGSPSTVCSGVKAMGGTCVLVRP